MHNIPEGLAVGVAFGSLMYDPSQILPAVLLALGIGIQTFPEGTAVSVPLRREGFSRKKAFFYGQLSGIVEPIFGILGALLAIKIKLILPFLLALAAGAMIYVVVEELIPEIQKDSIPYYDYNYLPLLLEAEMAMTAFNALKNVSCVISSATSGFLLMARTNK